MKNITIVLDTSLHAMKKYTQYNNIDDEVTESIDALDDMNTIDNTNDIDETELITSIEQEDLQYLHRNIFNYIYTANVYICCKQGVQEYRSTFVANREYKNIGLCLKI